MRHAVRSDKDNMALSGRVAEKLRQAGLRPTRQRVALCHLLFGGQNRHVTAEMLLQEAKGQRLSLSLATIYNTLHQFTHAGLLNQVAVDSERTYFDTNTSEHYHFLDESQGRLIDIPATGLSIDGLPEPPPGTAIERVDVIVRLIKKP